eukprot:11186567-Lingulodinium_polyedra.AAC.1
MADQEGRRGRRGIARNELIFKAKYCTPVKELADKLGISYGDPARCCKGPIWPRPGAMDLGGGQRLCGVCQG